MVATVEVDTAAWARVLQRKALVATLGQPLHGKAATVRVAHSTALGRDAGHAPVRVDRLVERAVVRTELVLLMELELDDLLERQVEPLAAVGYWGHGVKVERKNGGPFRLLLVFRIYLKQVVGLNLSLGLGLSLLVAELLSAHVEILGLRLLLLETPAFFALAETDLVEGVERLTQKRLIILLVVRSTAKLVHFPSRRLADDEVVLLQVPHNLLLTWVLDARLGRRWCFRILIKLDLEVRRVLVRLLAH